MSDNSDYKPQIPSVSELTDRIKSLLESNFGDILVEGEVSNVNRSRNGHIYFTVKDDGAQLSCVIWRSTAQRIGTALEDGQHVILGGGVQVYPPHGRYQLIVSLIQQAGLGKLQMAFEELKKRLQEEGLFEEFRKQPLPRFPRTIGVITSSTGAAFQDIRSTLESRWPMARVLLYHASVQGLNAGPELVRGLRYFSSRKDVDVLIIGRGGGSLEDLWPFNEEAVAREVYHCPIPVISAVGHETDFSISDFVADVRAATPTQAAVLATPDINEIRFLVDDLANTVYRSTHERVDRHREKLLRLSGSHALLVIADRLKRHREQISGYRQQLKFRLERAVDSGERIEAIRQQLNHRIERSLAGRKERLTTLVHRLEKMNPNAPLEQGYVRVWQNGNWIRQPVAFTENETFDLEWSEKRLKINSRR